jgi:hypothetical protein
MAVAEQKSRNATSQMRARSPRDDQALAGDDHPAAILPAYRLDAPEARQGVARLDLDH